MFNGVIVLEGEPIIFCPKSDFPNGFDPEGLIFTVVLLFLFTIYRTFADSRT